MFQGLGWHVLNFGAHRDRVKLTWAQLRRIYATFSPFWREAGLVLVVISAIAGLGVLPPLLLRVLLDQAIPEHNATLLGILCLLMVGIPILSGLLGILETWLDERISQGVMLEWRLDLFAKLQAQSMDYFVSSRPGELSSRLNNDINDLSDIFSDTVVAITSNVLTLGATLVVVLALDWRLAAMAIALVPLFIVPSFIVGRIRQQSVREAQTLRSDLHAFVQDAMSLGGFLMRRVFGNWDRERERFATQSRSLAAVMSQRALIWRWFSLVLGMFAIVGPGAIYWYGGLLTIEGSMTIGTVVAFVAYLVRLYTPVSALATVHVEIMGALAVFERLFGVLDAEPTVRDLPGAINVLEVNGHLSFRSVSFRYREDRPLLEDITFEAQPGQLVALVGPSGAGKTTLSYLVGRLYDPLGGSIRLDDRDLRDYTLESLQRHIATVTQEPFLFHTTLRENLLVAKPTATEEELAEACSVAHLEGVLATLPEGLGTVVGERGYRLSGGERQRVALARVLLKAPRILILDEATSSLDSHSEGLVQEALEPLMSGRTTIAIAHRLSTILHADQILVLDGGRVVERGRHKALLAAGKLYSRLYDEQFRRQEAPLQ